MFFSSRQARGPDHFLQWKVRLFLAGAALALIGIGLDSSALVGLAILVLVAGIVLRFLPTDRGERVTDEDEESTPIDQ